MIAVVGIAVAVLFAFYCNQALQNKIAAYAEEIRIHVKAQGGQEVNVQKVATPKLSGAMLFNVSYEDVDGRQIFNKVTIHTNGEEAHRQFWGEPVTPAR